MKVSRLFGILLLTVVATVGAQLAKDPETMGSLDRWIDSEFVTMFPFLEADANLGWRNAPAVERSWPEHELFSGPTDYIYAYQIGASGNRTSHFYAEHPLENPRATVWILGDSSAFGLGSPNEFTFAEFLKRELYPARVRVENASVVGYDSSQIRRQFEHRLASATTPPDLVILWAGFNDSRESWWYPLRKIPGAEQISNWRFHRHTEALLERAHARNIPVILNTLPSLEESRYLVGINREIRRLAEQHPGATLNDAESRFREHRNRNLYASIDEILHIRFHPSRDGHALIAASLLPMIGSTLDLSPERSNDP